MTVPVELRRSPLHEVHAGAGAVLTGFAGWLLPIRYASETAEHLAVRSHAGLFDLSHMAQLHVVGPGATAVLDRVAVSDISAVAGGRARYTLLCDDAGGVIDDVIVYRLAADALFVIANAANAAVVQQVIAAAVTGRDAQLTVSPNALIAVQGPRTEDVLAEVVADPAAMHAVRAYGFGHGVVAGVPVFLARTGYTGEDGFEISVDPGHAVAVWRALLAAGAGAGLVPAGLACRDTLRLEAGMALYGHELSRDTDPFQAGLGRVVALDKAADFTGRAALTRLAQQPPARVLTGLTAAGRRVLRAGQSVHRMVDGAPTEHGTVTSGAWSPTLQRSIAMAYLPAGSAEPGTELVAAVRGTDVAVTVTALPFYRRPRPAARSGDSGNSAGPAGPGGTAAQPPQHTPPSADQPSTQTQPGAAP